jgi:hypothetical protein
MFRPTCSNFCSVALTAAKATMLACASMLLWPMFTSIPPSHDQEILGLISLA